jgi:hypothetical protein
MTFTNIALMGLSVAVVYLAFFEPFTFEQRVNLQERVAELEADYRWHDSLLSQEDTRIQEWIRENQSLARSADAEMQGKLNTITSYLCGDGYIPLDRRDLCAELE